MLFWKKILVLENRAKMNFLWYAKISTWFSEILAVASIIISLWCSMAQITLNSWNYFWRLENVHFWVSKESVNGQNYHSGSLMCMFKYFCHSFWKLISIPSCWAIIYLSMINFGVAVVISIAHHEISFHSSWWFTYIFLTTNQQIQKILRFRNARSW